MLNAACFKKVICPPRNGGRKQRAHLPRSSVGSGTAMIWPGGGKRQQVGWRWAWWLQTNLQYKKKGGSAKQILCEVTDGRLLSLSLCEQHHDEQLGGTIWAAVRLIKTSPMSIYFAPCWYFLCVAVERDSSDPKVPRPWPHPTLKAFVLNESNPWSEGAKQAPPVALLVRVGGALSQTHSTQQFCAHQSTARRDSPMKPKMSLMVGTKMTSMLLKAKMAAAISMWRIQLNSRPLNSRVVMEERIWDTTQSLHFSFWRDHTFWQICTTALINKLHDGQLLLVDTEGLWGIYGLLKQETQTLECKVSLSTLLKIILGRVSLKEMNYYLVQQSESYNWLLT